MKLITLLVTSLTTLLSFFRTETLPPVQVPPPSETVQTVAAANQEKSANWSGYRAIGGDFTGVSGTWKVNASNPNEEYGANAVWVGVGGIGHNDLIQAGTMATVDEAGQVTYETFWEALPEVAQPFGVNVKGGDSVTVSIKETSSDYWQISVKNNTTGEADKIKVAYASSLSSAEWIVEAPSNLRRELPLNNFGTITFTKAEAVQNGVAVTAAIAHGQPITMANEYGQSLAVASELGNDGQSFSVTRSNQEASQTAVEISRSFRVRFRYK